MAEIKKIVPFLWFNDQAEEAINFYISIFKNSSLQEVSRIETEHSNVPGPVVTATFVIEDQKFMALNGGPHYTFSPATSFMVNCDSQQEVDYLWDNLSDGGEVMQCGWLTDKYGITWQIIPTILPKLIGDTQHPENAKRAIEAMLQMTKIDIEVLTQAYNGKE